MEGCAPYLVPGTKKGEVLMEGELMESLSLSPVSNMPMVLGDLVNPLVEILSLRATLFLIFIIFINSLVGSLNNFWESPSTNYNLLPWDFSKVVFQPVNPSYHGLPT
jgi:hypothetical protein